MGNRRDDHYRTVELVVNAGPTYRSCSVFAVRHDAGVEGRRLLWRGDVDFDLPLDSAERCLDLLVSAALAVRDHHVLPWR